jgi:hypothetical protein
MEYRLGLGLGLGLGLDLGLQGTCQKWRLSFPMKNILPWREYRVYFWTDRFRCFWVVGASTFSDPALQPRDEVKNFFRLKVVFKLIYRPSEYVYFSLKIFKLQILKILDMTLESGKHFHDSAMQSIPRIEKPHRSHFCKWFHSI